MTHANHDPSNVPELLLERYRLGEATPAEVEQLRRRLEADEGLRDRLRALDASDDAIRRQYSTAWLAARIRQRLRSNAPEPSASFGPGGVGWRIRITVAAVAMVALGVGLQLLGTLPLPSWRTTPGNEPAERIKGGNLVLFRKTPDGSEVVSEGARARPGDQLRIGYRAAGRPYGVILSIDGRGVVTRHLPQRGERAARLTPDGLVLLDYAYELDDAPGWERFFLVTGREAFDIGPVLEAARALGAGPTAGPGGALKLNGPFEQTSFVLMKEATR